MKLNQSKLWANAFRQVPRYSPVLELSLDDVDGLELEKLLDDVSELEVSLDDVSDDELDKLLDDVSARNRIEFAMPVRE